MAQDLHEAFERTMVHCLNAADDKPLRNAIGPEERENDGLHLESDCDAQLLIHITFSQVVKVQSLYIQCAEVVRDRAPTKVAVYVNKPNIDFSSSEKAVQELDLGEEQWAGKPIELKFTSFQNVSTLSLFVKENVTGDEDETTCISKLVVMGFTTALEGRKRSLEEQKAAQAGDWLNSK